MLAIEKQLSEKRRPRQGEEGGAAMAIFVYFARIHLSCIIFHRAHDYCLPAEAAAAVEVEAARGERGMLDM